MNQRTYRAHGYAALAEALQSWSDLPLGELLSRIDSPAILSVVQIEGQEIALDLSATWVSSKHDAICVRGVASGPSHWQIERIEESITIHLKEKQNA